ncbi:lipid A deacylase LpxR family protein [Caenispirillum salinarum]|uniref:lipid A deacylase LpxR family protein n=1 Tax=Caenispirillum salinarum TaxID=859058 RepID=UPI00384B50A1
MRATVIALFALALPALAAVPAAAQEQPSPPRPGVKPDPLAPGEPAIPGGINTEVRPRVVKDNKGIVTFQLENDLFTGTDRHYTNGVRLSYLSAENAVPDWVENAARPLPFFADEGNLRVSYALGQTMFTPEDITIAAPQPDERPWAGFTWGAIGLTNDAGSRLDNLELILGIVGPASQADDTQKLVHDIIKTTDPEGWDNQLHNEPVVNLSYKRTWRGWVESQALGLEVDAAPYVGGALGNAFTHGNVGLTVRFGDDLPADYGPPRIRPTLPGSDFFVPQQDFGWYVFAGMEGRLVARNIFLDGNTFRDSPSVEKNLLVGELQAGVAVTIGEVRLAYTHVVRSREYEGQDDLDRFGALSLSLRF